MRIRTDTKPYRQDVIDRVADHYGCNKTDAMIQAADHVPQLHAAVETILGRDDLTPKQKREIAETLSEARGMDVSVSETVAVELD